MFRTWFVRIAVLAIAASAWAARQPGQPLRPGFNLFSKQQDIDLGQANAKQVLAQYQVVQNQFLQDYFRRVGDRLAAAQEAKQSGFQFTFTLLNVPEVNAFALPGGPMFIFTGLLKATGNEAQLAGVMAHEMSHVILRHGTHEATKANFIQLPALLAGGLLGDDSIAGKLANLGLGLGANSVILKFSRDAESEADALGSHLMAESGYDPVEMARFFDKLAQGGSQGPQFLSDHPNPGNREQAILSEVRSQPRRAYGFQTGLFERAKTEVAALPAPPKKTPAAPAQPQTAAPAPASPASWRQFRGQTFSVSYPGDWQSYGDPGGSMTTLAPRDGLVKAQDGSTQVGCGAILSYFTPDNAGADLRTATDDLIHHLRSDNRGLQVTSRSPRNVKIGGARGLITMLSGASPYGGAETDALVTVARPEGLFYLVFVAPEKTYAQWESAFQQIVDSLAFHQ